MHTLDDSSFQAIETDFCRLKKDSSTYSRQVDSDMDKSGKSRMVYISVGWAIFLYSPRERFKDPGHNTVQNIKEP